ncbi:MFS transporter [Amycolatopsis orientalis]|uniref:MFS transporter n=1 Tax=Amycolatopsis orientalis TaxID=31958 RepID=UPI0003AA4802|nr:MFS transporter [Amycolatopsis orientalis]
MYGWFRAAPPAGRRAFVATFGGWALEAADAQIFGLVLPTLLALWHLSEGQAGLLASATLICTAVGGWLAGIASDRWGRVRVLQVTIAWYAVATALVGFAGGFESLLVTRCLQGFGFGGEWAAGAVLMSEYVGRRYRGRVLGAVQSGWAVGWGLALVAYSIAFAVLPPTWAWRAMFWLGVLPALLVVLIRRGVSDPPVYRRRKTASWAEIFRPGLVRVTVFGALLGLGSHGGYYALTTFLPTFLRKTRGLTVLGTTGYLAVFITASFLGYVVSGIMSDRVGRRTNIIGFAVLCLVSLVPFLLLPLNNTAMLVASAPLGFFSAGIPGGLGALFAELFPTEVRGGGQGFCYNLGRIVSAAFPAAVGFLSAQIGLATSIAVFAGAAYLLAIVAASSLPETRADGLPDASTTPLRADTSRKGAR